MSHTLGLQWGIFFWTIFNSHILHICFSQHTLKKIYKNYIITTWPQQSYKMEGQYLNLGCIMVLMGFPEKEKNCIFINKD